MSIMYYLVIIFALLFVSFAGAFDFRRKILSPNTFLLSISIGLGILIWLGFISPFYIVFSVLALGGMFIAGTKSEDST